MSVSSVIAKNGVRVIWTPMGGSGKTYDTSTGTMVGAPVVPKTISVVLDGFGSVESKLRSGEFGANSVVENGAVRFFCVEPVKNGDILTINGDRMTVEYCKTVWKKDKIVLYSGQVRQ